MMSRRRKPVAVVIPAAIAVIAHALANVLDSDDEEDGRSFRRPIARRFSMRQSLFDVADSNRIFDEGWFRNQFRCSKGSFDQICTLIDDSWTACHDPCWEFLTHEYCGALFVKNFTKRKYTVHNLDGS